MLGVENYKEVAMERRVYLWPTATETEKKIFKNTINYKYRKIG